MASTVISRCRIQLLNGSSRLILRCISQSKRKIPFSKTILLASASSGLACTCYLLKNCNSSSPLPTILAKTSESASTQEEVPVPNLSKPCYREIRFKQFASVEYEGNIYMTPQDFLESVTEETPRPRIGQLRLADRDLENMLRNTPARRKGSTKLFRNILEKGIISYTEYLFLLCVLTKPQSGFRIAFNMFDTDGNQYVDKKEFLVLEKLFGHSPGQKKLISKTSHKSHKPLQEVIHVDKTSTTNHKPLDALEEIFSASDTSGHRREGTVSGYGLQNKDSHGNIVNTTLLIHFFGAKGQEVLKFEDFKRFMEHLQSEVLELEFKEFSKGMPTISEVEFARILLRYTLLGKDEIDDCVERVRERIPQEKGITFDEFRQFCTFLNNLDDFTIVMKLYTLAGKPISQEEFQRAAKVCTGYTLQPHIVNTVFQIFDEDGDGHLSHQEFISIMKDRLHRGSRVKSHLMHTQTKMEAFKSCIKSTMRAV